MAYNPIKGFYSKGVVNARLKAIWTTLTALGVPKADGATFVIGTEAANVINVGVTLVDSEVATVASQQVVRVFVSDSATGVGIAATAPSSATAVGTDGVILVTDVAGKVYTVESAATGLFDLDVTETGTDTFYLVVVLPNGKTVVSGAITFAA